MANELVINYPTGSTLYVLLSDATGQVYNGSGFEAPGSVNWLNYGIAMSEAATATGIYRATMPAVAAGVYSFVVRKQAGGSPAVSDPTVGVGSIRWTGTAEEAVPAAVNVTLQAGAAVAPADMNGNVPVVLYGTQPAVTFGQVKILANVEAQGALHIVNSSGDGIGQYNSGGFSGLTNSGNSYGVRNETSGNDGVYSEGGSGGYGMNSSGGLGDVYPASGATIDPQDIANAALLTPVGVAEAGSQMDYLADILEDTGTTLPGLIAGVGSGSGTGYYTDTVESPSGTPLDGVRVVLATDEDGDIPAYEARTDAFGVFEMRPDPGTYYLFIEAAGHDFTQGVEVEVTEP